MYLFTLINEYSIFLGIINKPTSFKKCVNNWCYQKGTKQQYTNCKSISNDGKTCYQPEIRYGSTIGGHPAKDKRNNILQWCKQLFPASTRGTATYSSSSSLKGSPGPLFWNKGYDESGYKWCELGTDGYWRNKRLQGSINSVMTSVSCHGMCK